MKAPTPDEINALPEHLRAWIHALETRCDHSGELRELVDRRDQVEQLAARVVELERPKVGKVRDRVELVQRYDALVAENAKLREVAEKVRADFPPYREVELVDDFPNDVAKEVPTSELLCGICALGLDEHDPDCLYALTDLALRGGESKRSET